MGSPRTSSRAGAPSIYYQFIVLCVDVLGNLVPVLPNKLIHSMILLLESPPHITSRPGPRQYLHYVIDSPSVAAVALPVPDATGANRWKFVVQLRHDEKGANAPYDHAPLSNFDLVVGIAITP